MNENGKALLSFLPRPPGWEIPWNRIEASSFSPLIAKMKETPQNPAWHGEGDVWTHTQMVCEELIRDKGFAALPEKGQQIVFTAALFHDIGKVLCTRWEDGRWTSPGHALAGSRYARELLWKEYGICGTKEQQDFRESICSLIRYHSVPMHIADQEDPERRLFQIAAQGELASSFSLKLLLMLAKSDGKGRICDSMQASLDDIELCSSLAEDFHILDRPGQFRSSAVERAYFDGKQVWRQQDLYDETWGEVILMSGLPGTGKDTWIQRHCPSLPVVSLDEIRKELKISPQSPQGRVAQEARERARAFLRKQQPFVWNATDITSTIRKKQVALFEQYHAAVRIVFLETSWDEEIRRNQKREIPVPERAILQMLQKLEPPERQEAREVEWRCM